MTIIVKTAVKRHRSLMITVAALTAVFSLAVQAETFDPKTFDPTAKVTPTAQYSYAETQDCLNSIGTENNVSPKSGRLSIAMLGRLPACEIEKIIMAGRNERVKAFINNWIEKRKKR